MKKLFTLIAALCFFGSVSAVNHLFEISTSAKKTNAWDWGVDYQLATPLVQGQKYVLTLKASTTDETFTNMCFWPFGKDAEGTDQTQYLGFPIDGNFSEKTVSFTANCNIATLAFRFGEMEGKIFMDDIVLVKEGTTENLVADGDFENGEAFNSGWKFGWNQPTTYKIAEENFAPDPITLYPLGLTDLKTLTGTATDWASTVTYPKDFQSQQLSFGNGDGGSESTHVTISGYESISFVVSKVTNGGTALRVWLWNGAVTTLYPYPADQYETADFTKPYIITKPGVYTVKVAGYPYLKGVKSSNSWEIGNVAGVVTVDYAYVTKNGQTGVAKAIDGFRHFSSNKALDFTNMKHVEAYIVPDAHDGKVYMKKVEGTVPANTGLILKSDSDAVTITIPVVKTSDAELTNILVPVSEAKTVDVPEKGNNYLYDGTKWVAVSAPTAVPAGSCYLPVNSSLVSLTVTDSPISVGDSGFIEVEGSPYDPDKAPEGGIESATRPDHGLVDAPSDTTENNQQNGTATGINSAEAGSEIVSIVTANGARVNTLQKGINIVTYSNGKRVKVIK